MAQTEEEELILSGEVRPPNIPPNWLGEQLPESRGWRWIASVAGEQAATELVVAIIKT